MQLDLISVDWIQNIVDRKGAGLWKIYEFLLHRQPEKRSLKISTVKTLGHATICVILNNKNVKFTLERAMKAQRESRDTVLLFL